MLCPVGNLQPDAHILHPLQIVSIPNEQLGEYVASLGHDGSRIMDALDELLTQA
ncbi:MAG: CcdB family protein [Sulfuritalea sp.]|nr:CcdB family protein [Sulfuritalea sp.]